MKNIKFKYKPGDHILTKFAETGIIEELRYREGSLPQYAVWHGKSEYITYSEDQIAEKISVEGDKIGFRF